MKLLIGTDEAGYGPNLGPLVVAATAWGEERGQRSEVGGQGEGLYERLTAAVSVVSEEERIAVADSKRLYAPGGGVGALERGVLAALGCCRTRLPDCWSKLLQELSGSLELSLPWHDGFDPRLPLIRTLSAVQADMRLLSTTCETNGVQVVALRARVVEPGEFNQLVATHGNKASALSHCTLSLVRAIIDSHGSQVEEIEVVCDKHGGRNRYAALLQQFFPESWITIGNESLARSCYRFDWEGRKVSVTFQSQGEGELPVALASMTAKYLREVSMQGFNAFWGRHLPLLKPTAGYPLDAKRFRLDIAEKQRELNIADSVLWRCR